MYIMLACFGVVSVLICACCKSTAAGIFVLFIPAAFLFVYLLHAYMYMCIYLSRETCIRFHCVLRNSCATILVQHRPSSFFLNHNLLFALHFICSYNLLSLKGSNEIYRYCLHIAAAAVAKNNIFFKDQQLFSGHFASSCLRIVLKRIFQRQINYLYCVFAEYVLISVFKIFSCF